MTFGEKVMQFHEQLHYTGNALPAGIRIINPFSESGTALNNLRLFTKKYLDDNKPRRIILGINPGRLGAGVTGIPFTDTKRLISELKIPYTGIATHEVSASFVYDMINEYGGVKKFYSRFYISSLFPLAITQLTGGKEKNYNYYDNPQLQHAVQPSIIQNLRQLIKLGIDTGTCFCLGTGKNARFFNKLNEEYKFFGKIIPLEHPRFIMQYKTASKQKFIEKYINAFYDTLGES